MLFAIYIVAKPNTENVIAELLIQHRAYYGAKMEETYLAGPLFGGNDKIRVGGLMVIGFSDQEEANTFLLNQPYYHAGIIETMHCYPFEPLVERGKMLVQ